jgi:predicted flap endonuclease-1-like 5' DNA nuclease
MEVAPCSLLCTIGKGGGKGLKKGETMTGLPDDMGRLCGEIRDLHSGNAAFLNDLKAAVSGIKSEVSQMENGFRQSREEVAEKTRRDLKASTEDVRNFVSDLKSEASRLQDDFRSSFNTMARTGRSERGAFVADLRNSVGRLREEVISDLSAVRRMWSNPSPVQPVKKKQAEEEKSQEMSPDDLTKIPGIGSGIAMRLNQAGISTYAQLARSTHDQLRVALGKFAQLDDTYDWRGEARKFI